MTTFKVLIHNFYRGDVSIAENSHGFSMFCPRCGDIWARLESDWKNDSSPHHHLNVRMCPEHGAGLLFPLAVITNPTLRGERALIRGEFLKLSSLWLEHGRKTFTFFLPEHFK